MNLFRFRAADGSPRLGVTDDNGGRHDASLIQPEIFATVGTWLAADDPAGAVASVVAVGSDERRAGSTFYLPTTVPLLAPVDEQEVWAAGVTYERSKAARMDESREAGGGDFYDRVYDADRPELFFKSVGWRVVDPGAPVRIRRDSVWNVPEAEMVVVLSAGGDIVGVTAGNDMSSRSIEGENPLYLPQAKTYDGACAIGPVIRILSAGDESVLSNLPISIRVVRGGCIVFAGETTTGTMRRTSRDLAEYLTRETRFPRGAFLFTGTGIVPDNAFTLRSGDIISVTLGYGVGTLTNPVA